MPAARLGQRGCRSTRITCTLCFLRAGHATQRFLISWASAVPKSHTPFLRPLRPPGEGKEGWGHIRLTILCHTISYAPENASLQALYDGKQLVFLKVSLSSVNQIYQDGKRCLALVHGRLTWWLQAMTARVCFPPALLRVG